MAKTDKIDDAGEVISGAKKMLSKKALSMDIYEQLSDIERATLMTKAKVFPPLNYKELHEQGYDPLYLAVVKEVYAILAAKPNSSQLSLLDKETTNRLYIENMNAVREIFLAGRTYEDIKNWGKGILEYAGFDSIEDMRKLRRRDAPEQHYRFWGLNGRSNSHPLFVSNSVLSKARKLVSQGFPDDIPSWRKGVMIRKGTRTLVYRKKSLLFVTDETNDDVILQEVKRLYELEMEKKKDKKKTGLKIHGRPHLSRIERVGDDVRDRDISPDDFLESFGFRGVQFGEWLPNDERQEVLNFAFDALMDLSQVLDIEPKAISLNGTLALAFGARGSGQAAAHYEPGQKVMNLTRMNGAGSLCHEWVHALDHFLAGLGSNLIMEGTHIRYASGGHGTLSGRAEALPDLPKNVTDAIQDFNTSLYAKPPSFEDMLAKATRNIEIQTQKIVSDERRINVYKEAMSKLKQNTRSYKAHESELLSYQYSLEMVQKNLEKSKELKKGLEEKDDKALTEAATLFIPTKTTFFRSAHHLGEYWSRPNELWARSIESMVETALMNAGKKSDYLVHSAQSDHSFYETDSGAKPYPSLQEKEHMFPSFNRLMDVVRPLLENTPKETFTL